MKYGKKVLLVLVLVFSVIGFAGCGLTQYIKQQFLVEYRNYDDTVLYSYLSNPGEQVVVKVFNPAPTRESDVKGHRYDFVGWDQEIDEMLVYSDTIIKAVFDLKLITYSITYVCSGTMPSQYIRSYSALEADELYEKLPIPTMENKYFLGWQLNDEMVTAETVFDRNLVLKAVFEDKESYVIGQLELTKDREKEEFSVRIMGGRHPNYLEIPSEFNGIPVTSLENRDVNAATWYHRIYIPSSIKKIGTGHSLDQLALFESDELPESESHFSNAYFGVEYVSQNNNYMYAKTNQDEVIIMMVLHDNEDVYFPELVDGYPVKVIASPVFMQPYSNISNEKRTNVIVPNSVIECHEYFEEVDNIYFAHENADMLEIPWITDSHDRNPIKNQNIYFNVKEVLANRQFKYYLTHDDKAIITKWTGSDDVVIPKNVLNCEVIGLADNAIPGNNRVIYAPSDMTVSEEAVEFYDEATIVYADQKYQITYLCDGTMPDNYISSYNDDIADELFDLLPAPEYSSSNNLDYSFIGWQLNGTMVTEDTVLQGDITLRAVYKAVNEAQTDLFSFTLLDSGLEYSVAIAKPGDYEFIELPREYNGLPVTRFEKPKHGVSYSRIYIPNSIQNLGENDINAKYSVLIEAEKRPTSWHPYWNGKQYLYYGVEWVKENADFRYAKNNDDEIIIIQAFQVTGDLFVPETIDDYPVSIIAPAIFPNDEASINNVFLPRTVWECLDYFVAANNVYFKYEESQSLPVGWRDIVETLWPNRYVYYNFKELVQGDRYDYYITNDDEVFITRYHGIGHVAIPSSIDGMRVIGIGRDCIDGTGNEVYIPDSVNIIKKGAIRNIDQANIYLAAEEMRSGYEIDFNGMSNAFFGVSKN